MGSFLVWTEWAITLYLDSSNGWRWSLNCYWAFVTRRAYVRKAFIGGPIDSIQNLILSLTNSFFFIFWGERVVQMKSNCRFKHQGVSSRKQPKKVSAILVYFSFSKKGDSLFYEKLPEKWASGWGRCGGRVQKHRVLARDIVWLRFKPRDFPRRVPAMITKSNGSQAARTPVSTSTKALLRATRGLPAPSTCLHPPPHICTAFQRNQPNSHRI